MQEDGLYVDVFSGLADTSNLFIDLSTLGYDPDDIDLEYSIITDPLNATIDNSNISNGLIEFIPDEDYSSFTDFSYQVCDDDGLCVVNEVTIYIEEVNDAPVANSFSVSVIDAQIGHTINLSSHVSDIDDVLQGGIACLLYTSDAADE